MLTRSTPEMGVADQTVGAFDVVLLQHLVADAAPERGQRRFATEHYPVDDLHYRREPRPMHERTVASKPNFQHSNRVHAVLSDSNGSVASTIRSDVSMHVDPLSHCSNAESSLNSWGYLSLVTSALLRSAEIAALDFEESIANTESGDFLYVDPPYTAKHNNNNFVKYNERIFSWSDQIRLSRCVLAAARRGVHVLVSNANHASVRELYEDTIWVQLCVDRFSRLALVLTNGAGLR